MEQEQKHSGLRRRHVVTPIGRERSPSLELPYYRLVANFKEDVERICANEAMRVQQQSWDRSPNQPIINALKAALKNPEFTLVFLVETTSSIMPKYVYYWFFWGANELYHELRAILAKYQYIIAQVKQFSEGDLTAMQTQVSSLKEHNDRLREEVTITRAALKTEKEGREAAQNELKETNAIIEKYAESPQAAVLATKLRAFELAKETYKAKTTEADRQRLEATQKCARQLQEKDAQLQRLTEALAAEKRRNQVLKDAQSTAADAEAPASSVSGITVFSPR